MAPNKRTIPDGNLPSVVGLEGILVVAILRRWI